ncbi:MAG: T9SS type A sorting domain-containing protein, partial [Paludibacteraceae bacterium]|nr:T9SS type A sorting domain-containing protein [Paludibacteraceae bacterium]
DPISSTYKKNVMYSFHYYACSHYHLLGDFRVAQKHLPVFVSEWSAVRFNGDGPFCKENSDELIANCDNTSAAAPQLVSWCIWNWGTKDEASSFFNGSCDSDHISEYPSIDYSNKEYGSYILELMGYRGETLYCDSYWPTPNTIPSTNTSLWSWGDYDQGGESIGYHDANSGAWKTDENGIVVGYRNDGEEVDVRSLAKMMQWINEKCPWSTVEDGEVVSFDSTISTKWKDANGNPTYRSLNAGRMYSDPDSLVRPDEGVDLKYANLRGTNYEGRNYYSLYLVEDGEWISYTVDVEKAGYYKIKGLISSEYKAANKNGEISIYSWNNHLRSSKNLADTMLITTFGFPKINSCADSAANVSDYHNCWAEANAISGEYKEVFVAFPESGLQGISFRFSGDASGVGPLIFEWHGELDPNDPIVCGECENENGDVDDVDATKFSINPNPTSGEFAVTLADNVEASVEVVNMAGQVVASQKVVGSATINKSLTAGVYTVVVKTNAGVSTQKLVVK